MMEKGKRERYVANNKSISELLEENERILREEGYNPPIRNFAVDFNERVKIPSGYVRTTADFYEDYHLSELVFENNTKKNISYALQLSDYYNFIVNRFYVWGSIETMIYKQMFINVVSIIEALVLECANRVNDGCNECIEKGRCESKINKQARGNMKFAAEKLYDLGILDISKEKFERLIELYDYRNKIHIRLNEQNEYLDDRYNINLYNESIEMLKLIDETLFENAIPFYDNCLEYTEKKGITN